MFASALLKKEGRRLQTTLIINISEKGPSELLPKRNRAVCSADHMPFPGGAHFRL